MSLPIYSQRATMSFYVSFSDEITVESDRIEGFIWIIPDEKLRCLYMIRVIINVYIVHIEPSPISLCVYFFIFEPLYWKIFSSNHWIVDKIW